MTYKEAEALANKYDSALRADDKRFRGCVRLVLDDGSIFMWDSSFIMKIEDLYLAVFTEHHRFYVFDKSDIIEYRMYEEIHNTLEDLNG